MEHARRRLGRRCGRLTGPGPSPNPGPKPNPGHGPDADPDPNPDPNSSLGPGPDPNRVPGPCPSQRSPALTLALPPPGADQVGNASYVWLPMLRGQPGQRGCRNSSSRLGACVPGAWGYVIPRRVCAAHMLRTCACTCCTCTCCTCTCCARAVLMLSTYAMPRLPGSGHAMRWQPRQFMGTGVQGVQGEVGERHERPTAAAKAVAAPSLRRRDARRGAARHSRRTHSAPAPPAPPAPLAPPALQGCSARGSCGRVGATPHPAAPWPHRHAYRHR